MDASCDGNCHGDAGDNTGLQAGRTINIQIAKLGGEPLSFETHLSATISDIKALIHDQWGHPPRLQTLSLDTIILTDSNALLKDVDIDDGCLLTLILSNEPLGQSLLDLPDGSMIDLSRQGKPKEVLNEFQLMSLQAAWRAETNLLEPEDEDDWGNLGCWSIALYWTTRSNNCRYEYWSTAPGDNECGALVRIDPNNVTCIGTGSDDGLDLFKDFKNDAVAKQLIRAGWPRFYREEEDYEMVDDSEELEKEARQALRAMRKLNAKAKQKAIRKLPPRVQRKVMMAINGSTAADTAADTEDSFVETAPTSGGGLFDAAPAKWDGLFSTTFPTAGGLSAAAQASPATTGSGLVDATPTTSAGALFNGAGLFSAAPAATGGGLFGSATASTGGGLFGAADATTGGGLFGSASATIGGGLFGAASMMTGADLSGDLRTDGGIFGAASATTGDATTIGGLFAAAPATTGSSLFGTAPAATGANSDSSASVGTSSKQEECKTQ